MKSSLPSWIPDLKGNVMSWLGELMVPGSPFGRFRFARRGCVYMPYDIISVHEASGPYMKLNLTHNLTDREKQEWMDLSLSWRDPLTGEVRDPDGIEKALPDNDSLTFSVKAIRRSFSRCQCGVFGVRKSPLQEEVKAFLDVEKMRKAFDDEAWETNSWGAGAHCSHYILAMIQWRDAGHNEFDEAIKEAVEYLYARQNPETGAFGRVGEDPVVAIGGILKVYTRLFKTIGLEVRYPEKIIDLCLKQSRAGRIHQNCPVQNTMMNFLMCLNFTDYRRNEIEQEARDALEKYVRPLISTDGAFCSGSDDSQYKYWGIEMVEPGCGKQGNIHSTNLMLSTVIVITELLDCGDELGYASSGLKRKRGEKDV